MQNAKHWLTTIAVLLCSLAASAQTKVEINGIWYNLVSKAKQAEVTYPDGTEYSGSITIPATVTYNDKDYSVTSIGVRAFHGCRSLTDITIPESVTSIGENAFYNCTLTTINIPENSQLASIDYKAFERSHLTTITLPESVTNIGWGAFCQCGSLTSINIPKNVTWIPANAFWDCSSLTTISIPEGVMGIDGHAFKNCHSLEFINSPKSVTHIGDYAFCDCRSLTAITIPEGVTSIYNATFYGCNNLTSINIPESVTSIGVWAFEDCRSLTSINIPANVKEIDDRAFYGCKSLTSITIPEGVTSIEESTFEGCSSLTTIVLPTTLRKIWKNALANCIELLDVYCYSETMLYTSLDAFDGSLLEYTTLHVPTSALESYKSTSPWSGFGSFATLDIAVSEIILNQTEATLFEGERLALTATVNPSGATDKCILWSSSNPAVASVNSGGIVTAVALGTATITATANDGSGVSASCEIVVNELIRGKCAAPIISYADGKVIFACDTEEVTFVSETTEDVAGNRNDAEFTIIPTYIITVYATKEHYENSDEVTLTLCWIPCCEEHEDEETGIITIPSKPVLISTQGGTITVSGLAAGTAVVVTTTAGTTLATATATDGTATLATNLTQGNIAIVKMGDYSIKVAIK